MHFPRFTIQNEEKIKKIVRIMIHRSKKNTNTLHIGRLIHTDADSSVRYGRDDKDKSDITLHD